MKTSAFGRRVHVWALTLALLAAMSPTGHVAAGSCGGTYTVTPGNSLWSISATCDGPIAPLTRLSRFGAHLQLGRVVQKTDASTPPAAPHMYVVQPGDTLSGIAQRLDLTPATLAAENGIADLNIVRAGSVLRWLLGGVQSMATARPAPAAASATTSSHVCASVTYTVQPGDTLSAIAMAYHVDVAALAAANGIADPNLLLAGATLCIPPATAVSPAAAPSTTTTGITMHTYVVQPGDTLSGIGRALGLTAQALAQANGLALTMPIRPAQVLRYPVSVSGGPSGAQVSVSGEPLLAQVGAVLDQQAAAVGVDSALLKAVAWRESNWRMVDAPDGGIGVMQLMPDTVRWLKQDYVPGTWDPHDLMANVHAGAVLLLLYSRLYGGDVARIVAAYHGGMGALVQGTGTSEMARYVDTVIAYRRAFLNGTFP